MTTTASGYITATEELLRTTIATCTAFQAWVGAASVDEALEHIYLEALPPADAYADRYTLEQLKARRPYCHIWTDDVQGYTVTRIAAVRQIADNGILHVRFEQAVSEDIRHDFAEVDRLFKNTLGDIIESGDESNPGVVELNQKAGYLAWESLTLSGPYRSHDNEATGLGDFQEAMLEIRWGIVS